MNARTSASAWLRSSDMIFTLDAVPHRTRTIKKLDVNRHRPDHMPVHSSSVLLVLLLGCATAAADPPPVMFRGNPEHTGVSSASFFPGQGGVKWRVQTGGAVRSSPAVTATRLFVGSGDGHLYALERTRGAVLWKFAAGDAER